MYLRGDSACFQTDKRGREPLFRSLWAVRVAAPSTPSKSRSQPAYPGLRTEGTPSLHTQAQRLEFRRRAWPVDSCHPVSRSLDGPVAQPRRQFRIALGPPTHTPPTASLPPDSRAWPVSHCARRTAQPSESAYSSEGETTCTAPGTPAWCPHRPNLQQPDEDGTASHPSASDLTSWQEKTPDSVSLSRG